MACNRDELHARPDALPPRVVRFGRHLAILPIDPVSGGTWVAVNDAAVMFALLNVNPPQRKPIPADARSRGLLIPSLLHCGSVRAAHDRLAVRGYQPFRLVAVDVRAILECTWDGDGLTTRLRDIDDRPTMFTSSGLGDHFVAEPRARLFESFLDASDFSASRQDEFHSHRWEAEPHLSVCMSRRDARTVSYTTVQVAVRHVTLTYLPGGPDARGGPSHWCLNRA